MTILVLAGDLTVVFKSAEIYQLHQTKLNNMQNVECIFVSQAVGEYIWVMLHYKFYLLKAMIYLTTFLHKYLG